jgi:hypothetical protein
MDAPAVEREFHYRLPSRIGGQRPGAHKGHSLGGGQLFAGHRRLLDHPDPRRLDLRASLRDSRGDWLVQVQRQRVAIPVHAIVDVSASMHFGTQRSKLQVAADFVEAMGTSAFRIGDPAGLSAYDGSERDDLYLPARHGRGAGVAMAALLRDSAPRPPTRANGAWWRRKVAPRATPGGLAACAARLAGRRGLVFVVSDFHGPLDDLAAALDALAHAFVVPMIAWDPAETTPPDAQGLLAVRDAETGARRTLWLREGLRREWREAVAARRAELNALFAARDLRSFELLGAAGAFDAEALTQYFLETVG